MVWRKGIISGLEPHVHPGDVHPARKGVPDHPNGIVVFAASAEERDGFLRPVLREIAAQRAVLFFVSVEEACTALEEIAGHAVCVVSCRSFSAAISSHLRKEAGSLVRSLPLLVLARASDDDDGGDDLRKKVASFGSTLVTDIHRIAARVLSMPTRITMESEGTAGLFQGQLVDIQVGDESIKGKDWVFSDNRQWLLKGMHASRMTWYPRALGYDEHISDVAAYMQALQPVHRCAPGTFLAILREGGLLSRHDLEQLFGGGDGDSASSHILRTARHARLQEVSRDSRFFGVKRQIFKYAEAKCELELAKDDAAKKEAANKNTSMLWKQICRSGLSDESLLYLEEVVDEVVEDVCKAAEGSITGIGYSKDASLGTDHHVFSTLGPNRGFHYGSVVLFLSPNLMYHPDTWISPLAATGYVGPQYWVFRHRPWSGAALLALSKGEDQDEYKEVSACPENDERGVEACVKSSVNMAAVEGWSLIMAREVDAMCHYLAFDHRQAYSFDDGTRSGMAGHGVDWTDDETRANAASKLMDADKQRLLPGAWETVVEYYETKDSHTLYECHLPGFVPLGAIEKVCISSDLYAKHTEIKDKVDKFVLPDERKLKDLIVMTENGEECMKWQHDWIDARRQERKNWQKDWFEARHERCHWDTSSSWASIASEGEKCRRRPMSLRLAGRAGRPCFLPPDISHWGRRFKQHEYAWWKKHRFRDFRVSFGCRAYHNIRVFFSSTTEPQRPAADLKDEKWKTSTYHIALGVNKGRDNWSSFITKGILGTKHQVHVEGDPSADCTRSGSTMMDSLGVWDTYWFWVRLADDDSSATVSCGKGEFGQNVLMTFEDTEPVTDLKYIGLSCWNEPTIFCDLVTEFPYD